jgi:hypothetical protein
MAASLIGSTTRSELRSARANSMLFAEVTLLVEEAVIGELCAQSGLESRTFFC